MFEGLISLFLFLCFGIIIFSFCFFGKSPENEFHIFHFPFLILRFDLMLSFATHALIYIPILSSDTRAKKVFASAPIITSFALRTDIRALPFRVHTHIHTHPLQTE